MKPAGSAKARVRQLTSEAWRNNREAYRLAQGSFLPRRLAALARALARTPRRRAARRGASPGRPPRDRVRRDLSDPELWRASQRPLAAPPRGPRPHLRVARPRHLDRSAAADGRRLRHRDRLDALGRRRRRAGRRQGEARGGGRRQAVPPTAPGTPRRARAHARWFAPPRRSPPRARGQAARRRGRAPARARDRGRRRLRPRDQEGAGGLAAEPRPHRRRRGRPADARGARPRRRRGARLAPARRPSATRASAARPRRTLVVAARAGGGVRALQQALGLSRRTACSAPPPSGRSSAGSAATGSRRTAWPDRRRGPRWAWAPARCSSARAAAARAALGWRRRDRRLLGGRSG